MKSQLLPLIKHLVTNHLEEITEKSLLHCHVRGVHSIVLLDSPEQTIRVFIATEDHQLYKNLPSKYADGMSVGFHPHHMMITLHCIQGEFLNWIVEEAPEGDIYTNKYLYQSQITHGEMAFDYLNITMLKSVSKEWINAGHSVQMNPSLLHTVAVPKGQTAAWLVYEGKEDKNYQSFCYTTSDPNTQKEGLYQKPDKSDITFLLNSINLYD